MRSALVVAMLWSAQALAEEPHWANDEAHRWAEQATVLHKQAQQEKSPKKYDEAHALYQQYLAKYPDINDGQLSFFDGELLYTLQRYDEAAKMYDRVLTIAPKGRYLYDAANAYVIATKSALAASSPDDGGAPCPGTAPCPLSADAQRMVGAFDRYLAVVHEGGERPAMEYRRARIWYDYNHFSEAATLLDHIFATYPQHELATYSANLEMDCLAILKRYADLRALVERIKKSPAMRDETVRHQVEAMDAALAKKAREAR